ncbi:MAG: amidase [Geminicoccaceae bacterium]|nr:amidase [Geminicoccaceae bacterium]
MNSRPSPIVQQAPIVQPASGFSRRELLARSVLATTAVLAGAGARRALAQTVGGGMPDSIAATGEQLRKGSLSVAALVRAHLDCAKRLQPQLNAFILLLEDRAMRQAVERDRELASGRDRGPLHGIPIVMKDIFEMAGTVTTVGSAAFRDRRTEQDATAVRRLEEAGAIVLGKTNMNEFAAGVSGTNAVFGDTHNPWALARSPGGSSAGTGAALAAGIGLGGTGTDTGGSIRVPASWCGITGIRPTYGLVSLAGVFPRAPSLDVAGPLARNVRDLAYLLDAMAGFDPAYPGSALAQPRGSYTTGLDQGVKGLKLATVKNYTYRDVEPSVADAVKAAAETFARLGAEVSEIEIEPLEGRLDYGELFNKVLLFEFNQVLGERYRNTPNAAELYGPIVQKNIEVGSRVPREDYERLLKERPALTAEVKSAFREVDALLTPALPTVAPLLSASAKDYGRGRQFTIPFSYTALPSAVVPAGFSPEGLPIGLQIVGDHFQEAFLLQVAAAFEAATDFGQRQPPVHCDWRGR